MRRLRYGASHLHWDGPEGPGNVPVRVGLRPYRRFDRWIDAQLARLVDRWARPSPPSVERPEPFAVSFKPK